MNDTIVPINNGSDFERMPERNVDGVTIHFDVALGESVGRKLLVVGGGMGRGKRAIIGTIGHIPLMYSMLEYQMRHNEMVVLEREMDVLRVNTINEESMERGIRILEDGVRTIIPIESKDIFKMVDYFDKPTCSPREWGQKKKKRKKK